MAEKTEKRSANRREAAALLLARGATVRSAARSVEMGERTLGRWLAEDAAFADRVRELRDTLFADATGRLAGLTSRAAKELGELLGDADSKVKLRAATAILDAAAKYRDQLDLAGRLAEAEERLAALDAQQETRR